eukprot:CAMPEP_0197394732 /NCGR_PEP_ID=MMETSP1165-20131217/5912_1 /TAXON_ID=284809 /ORGANISM="Chrysocystis fragilis, Strain CCMP3189" /LENGTH=190 /DNA_ID=CAMNT_0042920461 /DNA_START=157 /DNA_END=730 /DNA_ORIENTATION=-
MSLAATPDGEGLGAAESSGEGLFGHDGVELVGGDFTVAVGVGALDHLHQLGVRHGLAEFLGDALEVPEGDVSGLVVVEKVEDFLDVLAGVLVRHFGGHHVEKLLEVDGAAPVLVDVRYHLVDRLVLRLEAERLHRRLELLGVDRAGAVGVEEVERLADLLDLVLGQARPLVRLPRPLPWRAPHHLASSCT